MANILFAWEMGVGFGHIMPYLDLIRVLAERGHRIGFVTRDLANTEQVLGGLPVLSLQAPALYGRARNARLPGSSYIDVLHNTGFSDPMHLKGRMRAWIGILELFRPDLVICDGAPAASLAARRFDCGRITSGTGFFVPPPVSPPPSLRYWDTRPLPLAAQERELIEAINPALEQIGEPTIGALHELVACDDQFLTNFRELDHYPHRGETDYLGTYPTAGFGADHHWPDIPGKRIFAYLYPFKTLGSLFESMERLGVSATIYAPEVKRATQDKHRSPRLRFVDRPVSLHQVMEGCDLVMTNGSLSSSASVLLFGKPILVLPVTLEKQIVGQRIQDLGAGLSAPMLKPGGMAAKLEALLERPQFGERARDFADRYADQDKEWQLERMLEKIDRLLGRGRLA